MVKTYQLGKKGTYGTSLKVAPVTTETELNTKTCLQVNGSSEITIEPQSVLPSLVGFECIGIVSKLVNYKLTALLLGSEVVNGFNTEKWRLVQTIGQKVNRYTMWMTYKNNEGSDPDPVKYAVPVR